MAEHGESEKSSDSWPSLHCADHTHWPIDCDDLDAPNPYVTGCLRLTSATRLRAFRWANTMAAAAAGDGSNVSFPSMLPSSRIFFVSARVSTPYSAGTLCYCSHRPRLLFAS